MQKLYWIFSSTEPKARDELLGWDSSRRPSVRASVCAFTLSNINISETSWTILINFIWSIIWWGKAAFDFEPDRMRIQVSMATDSSHRVIMRKTL